MSGKNKRKFINKTITDEEKDTVLRTAVTVAVVLLILGIIVVVIRLMNPRVDTKDGIKKLQQMEAVEVTEVDSQIQELEEAERAADEEWVNRPANEKFANAFVIGDSITQGLYEYGVLDQSHVQADRGAGVCGVGSELAETHIAKVIELQPQVLFLAYGMNDIKGANADAGVFAETYKGVIDRLKEALPKTRIYVNSVLPVQQHVIDENAGYGAIPQYNEQLEKLCEEEEITFIDNGSLVKEEYYSEDGIHVAPEYYTGWVDHMAEVAKL